MHGGRQWELQRAQVADARAYGTPGTVSSHLATFVSPQETEQKGLRIKQVTKPTTIVSSATAVVAGAGAKAARPLRARPWKPA